jgi:hypothetical protein
MAIRPAGFVWCNSYHGLICIGRPQEGTIMGSIDWVSFAIGVVMVGLGFLCFFSTRLQQWGMEYTSQGVVWGKIVGAKRAPYIVKYVSSAGFLLYAGFIFYGAFFGP